MYQSYEAGQAWLHLNSIPAGQFYRITLDGSTPYRIAGGLQDNLNWVGPSRTRSKDGILNSDWTNIGGGDGFSCAFDAEDPIWSTPRARRACCTASTSARAS